MPRAIAARIATELTPAEAVSREAEAALAGVLAREAAMRAERRVAEAALEAARTQAGALRRRAGGLPPARRARRRRSQRAAIEQAGSAASEAAEHCLPRPKRR